MIDEHAIVHPNAKIASNVEVGPFSIIGPDVEIGEGTWVGPHAVLKGPTKIGRNNKIYQFSSIGEDCQDQKYNGEPMELVIGDGNTFRENCTVHRGTVQGGGLTSIGNNNLFMVSTHVAHDCIIGDSVIFSNGASIAGHVIVSDHVILAGLVGVHQFCKIGAHSFCAAGSIITKDVLPFVLVSGNPSKVHGLNMVGLNRRAYSRDAIDILSQAYKIIFRRSHTTAIAIQSLEPLVNKLSDVTLLIDFLKKSDRGIIR